MAFDKRRSSSVNCLYALGGGRVVDGMFPEPRVLSAACRAEFATYFVSIAYHISLIMVLCTCLYITSHAG